MDDDELKALAEKWLADIAGAPTYRDAILGALRELQAANEKRTEIIRASLAKRGDDFADELLRVCAERDQLRARLDEAIEHVSNLTAVVSQLPRTPDQRKTARELGHAASAWLSMIAFLAPPNPPGPRRHAPGCSCVTCKQPPVGDSHE